MPAEIDEPMEPLPAMRAEPSDPPPVDVTREEPEHYAGESVV